MQDRSPFSDFPNTFRSRKYMGQPPGGQITLQSRDRSPLPPAKVSSNARSFMHPFPVLVVTGKFPFLRMAQTIPETVSPRLEADAISTWGAHLPSPSLHGKARDGGRREGCRLQEGGWRDASKNSAVPVWDKA